MCPNPLYFSLSRSVKERRSLEDNHCLTLETLLRRNYPHKPHPQTPPLHKWVEPRIGTLSPSSLPRLTPHTPHLMSLLVKKSPMELRPQTPPTVRPMQPQYPTSLGTQWGLISYFQRDELPSPFQTISLEWEWDPRWRQFRSDLSCTLRSPNLFSHTHHARWGTERGRMLTHNCPSETPPSEGRRGQWLERTTPSKHPATNPHLPRGPSHLVISSRLESPPPRSRGSLL